MTRQALIAKVAADIGVAKVRAEAAIDSIVHGVARALRRDGSVSIRGLGTFAAARRAKRSAGGRPRRGVRFRPSPALLAALGRGARRR